MDKKHQKIAAVMLSFLAVFLLVGLPALVSANAQPSTSIVPLPAEEVGKFAGQSWYQILIEWVISGFGTLVAIIGWSLDYAIENFILGFGAKYQSSNLGDTINSLWSTVRDIFNLTFIFGLIFIGFKMILDASDSHARHTLVSLIGAALLVNFSLFITKFIVDFSDLAAYKVFQAFQNGSTAPVSISMAFANLIGMSSIFNNGGLASAGAGSSLLYLVGTLLVLLVLGYVYLAGAVLIIIRFVVLSIYLIFSPVMFLGWVFPSMHKRSEDYWHGFLGQAFFAPAFLFMLYLSFKIIDTYNDQVQKLLYSSEGGYFNHGAYAQADSLIPFFIMTITFLIASMVVAKNMGAVGASNVIKIGNNVRTQLGGAVAGFGGYKAYNRIDKWSTSSNPLARGLGRSLTYVGVRDTAQKAYKSSIQGQMAETRKKRTGEMATRQGDSDTKKTIKKHAKGGGVELENAVKGATSGQLISLLRDYKTTDVEYKNIVGAMTYEQKKKLMDAKDDEFNATEKASLSKTSVSKISSKVGDITNNTLNAEATAKLTPKEIDTLGNKWITDNLAYLSNSQVEKLATDSTVLTESEKSTLKQKWEREVEGLPTTDYAMIMHKRSAKDVAALPAAVLVKAEAAPYLSEKVLRAIAESNMTSTNRDSIEQIMALPNAELSGQEYLTRPRNNHRDTNW